MGYTYVGGNSLYGLLWEEIYRIVDASNLRIRIESDKRDGVRPGDMKKLQEYSDKLRQKNRT